MYKQPKNVSKSIRLTEDLYKYIDNYCGDGFNEKFENVILDARHSENKRLIRLEMLQKDYDRLEAGIRNYNSLLQNEEYTPQCSECTPNAL